VQWWIHGGERIWEHIPYQSKINKIISKRIYWLIHTRLNNNNNNNRRRNNKNKKKLQQKQQQQQNYNNTQSNIIIIIINNNKSNCVLLTCGAVSWVIFLGS